MAGAARPLSRAAISQDFVYGEVVNTRLLSLLGDMRGAALDVGCGVGAWADALRESGATSLVGVEPNGEAAARARGSYDLVVEDALEHLDLDALSGQPFSHVIVADVLEHLVNPWDALRRLHRLAGPSATLAISVPNARYYRLSLGLLVMGKFSYGRAGVMDWTHLRWFTQSSLDRSLRLTGWLPQRWDWEISGRRARLGALLRGTTDPLLASQIRVVATRMDASA
jgi:2-polyprenyl-3-methyl-5-hydroxy-6-metoxy-1,4-benzoquinol methylase